VNRRPSKN
jgi:hypothetical protein